MINPSEFIDQLRQTFNKSAKRDFELFLERNHKVRKWMIAADYCIKDKNRPNDVFAFTILPFDSPFEELKNQIKAALPQDLKKSKILSDQGAALLSDNRIFHFGFVLAQNRILFYDGSESNSIDKARQVINHSCEQLINAGRQHSITKHIRRFRHESLSNKFNVNLAGDLFLLSWFLSFITSLLYAFKNVERIGWFSDRDKMTTWCKGILWVLANENLNGLASEQRFDIPKGSLVIALDETQGSMWFDEFVRLSDYIAGILAAWDFDSNGIVAGEKYTDLAQKVVADSNNMAIFRVNWGREVIQCGRIIAKKVSA